MAVTTSYGAQPSGGAPNAGSAVNLNTDDLPPPQGERHIIPAEEELRIEVAFVKASVCQIVLQKGSCELLGVELALRKVYRLEGGGLNLALYTYHGCVVDVECQEGHEISYVSDETPNIAYVNTHAQLEALRDEAYTSSSQGPRVLVCGPTESGKSSLVKTLLAYATKLGRTPLWVDLDPADNGLSVPGTLAVCPMNRDSMTISSQALGGIPPGTASPLTLWHGSTKPSLELFQAQVSALGQKIDSRLQHDDWERSSGVVVNTNGWITDDGYQMLLHAVQSLSISVILIMGHDRLYSTLRDAFPNVKVIKLPRSGGVIARDAVFLRQARSRSIRRYFYGDLVDAPVVSAPVGAPTTNTPARIPQLTPFLAQIPFQQLKIYKFTSLSLSASLLPVAAAQTTEAVQLVSEPITEQLAHRVLAVCHPQAVAAFSASGNASDLYTSGVAGFVAVERVGTETEILHVLSPCAGALPSYTFLVGDVTWMD